MIRINMVRSSSTLAVSLAMLLAAAVNAEGTDNVIEKASDTKAGWNINNQDQELELIADAQISDSTDIEVATQDATPTDSNLDDAQTLDEPQANSEQLNPEQLNPEQLNPEQLNPEQLSPEQLSPEQAKQAKRVATIESRQLSENLEQQFKQLRSTLATEDAFSPQLGEDYMGYGRLLRESGEFKEAIEAFVNALHIAKVNDGIYSLDQRVPLKELFETHYALNNTEDYEDYLERILWVESKNPDKRDSFSYHMLLKVGNQYIDQFLRKPIAGQSSVETLLRARRHLAAALRLHGNLPLAVIEQPFGELALISFLESKVQPDVDQTALLEDSRVASRGGVGGRPLPLSSYITDSFPRGQAYLSRYLKKAKLEDNSEHVVRALLSLGDFHQLFKRHPSAKQYYELAWLESQQLPEGDELRMLFQKPVSLPNFSYAYKRENIKSDRLNREIPLILQIADDGTVSQADLQDVESENSKYLGKARRSTRRMVFRPMMVDGKAVATNDFEYSIKIYSRK